IKASFDCLLSNMGFTCHYEIIPLSQAGSDRRYFRLLIADKSFIGTYTPDANEGYAFVMLSRDLKSAGAAVPEVFAVSDDFHYYVQEDLGDSSLFSLLPSPDHRRFIKDTLARLAFMQKIPLDTWHDDCLAKDFSRRQVMWDLNYFKYEYLKARNVVFDEDLLEDDFERLAENLLSFPKRFWGFMMRDCQSRNVMVVNDTPLFIDFQAGRYGPAIYDAVSFLWQARACFSKDFREEMLCYYCDVFCNGDVKLRDEMMTFIDVFVLFRTLQVLGAYGYRGLVQHRSHFILSIPPALANLHDLIDRGVLNPYPELSKACEALTSDPISGFSLEKGLLRVDVYSFSYKKGYPENLSGNGGGFMFDCRAMHNPGRYKEYKQLTGRDPEVIAFLENRGEVQSFLKNAWALTDPAIERYISRGFSHLQIGFGCTGGQHRSVYCAEHTAAHIRRLFPEADLHLIHLEHPNP
ncbi:MAG: phosphotransferase, partial [Muribaculaceae bacterium]|nr:phosphotransferase [Muribaculaceae bacterium]